MFRAVGVLLWCLLGQSGLSGPAGNAQTGVRWNVTLNYPSRTTAQPDSSGGFVRTTDWLVSAITLDTTSSTEPFEIDAENGLLQLLEASTGKTARLLFMNPATGIVSGMTDLITGNGDISDISVNSITSDDDLGLIITVLEFSIGMTVSSYAVQVNGTRWSGTAPEAVAGGQSSITLSPPQFSGKRSLIVAVNQQDGSLAYATLGPAASSSSENAACDHVQAMPGVGLFVIACDATQASAELMLYEEGYSSNDATHLLPGVANQTIPDIEQNTIVFISYSLAEGLPLASLVLNEDDALIDEFLASDIYIEMDDMAAAADADDFYAVVRFGSSEPSTESHNTTLGISSHGIPVLLSSVYSTSRSSWMDQVALLRFRATSEGDLSVEQSTHLQPASTGIPSASSMRLTVSPEALGGHVALCGSVHGTSIHWPGAEQFSRERQSSSEAVKGFGFISILNRMSMESVGNGIWDGVEAAAGTASSEGCVGMAGLPTGGFAATVLLLGGNAGGVTNFTRDLTVEGAAGVAASNYEPVLSTADFSTDLALIRYGVQGDLRSVEVMGYPQGSFEQLGSSAMTGGLADGAEGSDTVFFDISHTSDVQFGSPLISEIKLGAQASAYLSLVSASSLGNTIEWTIGSSEGGGGGGGSSDGSISSATLEPTSDLVFAPIAPEDELLRLDASMVSTVFGGAVVGRLRGISTRTADFEEYQLFSGAPAGGRDPAFYSGFDSYCASGGGHFLVTGDGKIILREDSEPINDGMVIVCVQATNQTALARAARLSPGEPTGNTPLDTGAVFVAQATLQCNVNVTSAVYLTADPMVPASLDVAALSGSSRYEEAESVAHTIDILVLGVEAGSPLYAPALPFEVDEDTLISSLRNRTSPVGSGVDSRSLALVKIAVRSRGFEQVEAQGSLQTGFRMQLELTAPRSPLPRQVDSTAVHPSYEWLSDKGTVVVDLTGQLDQAAAVGATAAMVEEAVSKQLAREILRSVGRPVDWFTARSCQFLSGSLGVME